MTVIYIINKKKRVHCITNDVFSKGEGIVYKNSFSLEEDGYHNVFSKREGIVYKNGFCFTEEHSCPPLKTVPYSHGLHAAAQPSKPCLHST